SDRKSASAEINRAAQTAAEVKLQQAAFAVEQFHALNGTYAASSLGGLGVRLSRADASSYCLESGSGATIAHLAGPGGTPAAGAIACPSPRPAAAIAAPPCIAPSSSALRAPASCPFSSTAGRDSPISRAPASACSSPSALRPLTYSASAQWASAFRAVPPLSE